MYFLKIHSGNRDTIRPILPFVFQFVRIVNCPSKNNWLRTGSEPAQNWLPALKLAQNRLPMAAPFFMAGFGWLGTWLRLAGTGWRISQPVPATPAQL